MQSKDSFTIDKTNRVNAITLSVLYIMNLFVKQDFKSHSGSILKWKVECDALTSEDWECLAYMISERVKFASVEGVPTGGYKLADALKKYCDPTIKVHLIVDDVCTTGGSLWKQLGTRSPGFNSEFSTIGYVVFARDSKFLPIWCGALWYGDIR